MNDELEKILKKIDELEKSLNEKDVKMNELIKNNDDLKTKIATMKVENLTRDISSDEVEKKVDEDITFDFDF